MLVRYCGATVASSIALLGLLAATGCAGPGGKYAGNYKRDLYGEGEVQMKLAGDGGVEITLPSPRWADNPTIKGKATFKGDTLVFAPDTAGAKCAAEEARYVFSQNADELNVAGVGMDACGARHAALEGSWKKASA
jgi:hypothetical protein